MHLALKSNTFSVVTKNLTASIRKSSYICNHDKKYWLTFWFMSHRKRVKRVFTVQLRMHTHGLAVDVCPSVRRTNARIVQNKIIVCEYMNTVR